MLMHDTTFQTREGVNINKYMHHEKILALGRYFLMHHSSSCIAISFVKFVLNVK